MPSPYALTKKPVDADTEYRRGALSALVQNMNKGSPYKGNTQEAGWERRNRSEQRNAGVLPWQIEHMKFEETQRTNTAAIERGKRMGYSQPWNEYKAAQIERQTSGASPISFNDYMAARTTDAGGYDTVTGGGSFTGTRADYNALSSTDQSKLIMLAAGGADQGSWTRDDIIKEYKMEDHTPESVEAALTAGDPALLVRRDRIGGQLTPALMGRELDAKSAFGQASKVVRALQVEYGDLIAALNTNTGPGDMAAIFKFMKTLDPGSTVREGEFQLAARSAGKVEEWSNIFASIKEGVILTPKQRGLFAELAGDILMNSKATRDSTREDALYGVGRYGFDERAVLGTHLYDYDDIPKYEPRVAQALKEMDGDDGWIGSAIDYAADQYNKRFGGQ